LGNTPSLDGEGWDGVSSILKPSVKIIYINKSQKKIFELYYITPPESSPSREEEVTGYFELMNLNYI